VCSGGAGPRALPMSEAGRFQESGLLHTPRGGSNRSGDPPTREGGPGRSVEVREDVREWANREIVRNVQFHHEDSLAVGLALGVGLQAGRTSAAEGVVKDEIEGTEVRDLVARHATPTDLSEMLRDPFGRQLLEEHGERLLGIGKKTDVGIVPLVPGAGMGDLCEPDPHGHTSTARTLPHREGFSRVGRWPPLV